VPLAQVMNPITIDSLILNVDSALRTLHGVSRSRRENPADAVSAPELTETEKRHSGRLMRVNHCGEICAQALYLGQGLTSDNNETRLAMQAAADEETDHLAWCETRLAELDSHKSYLNPVFYALSFASGAISGLLGDRFNLGFVAATEEQVVKHLDEHLEKLPDKDLRSKSILAQMRQDEDKYRTVALARGGTDFPSPVKGLMSGLSRLMTRTTYWI